jgi:DNA adenine methylase
VEVFGGSGAVLLSKAPSKLEVFNDRFAGSVALYRAIQNDDTLRELKEKIELMPHSREFFAWCRDTWEKEEGIADRAARWYYLVQASFAGRCEFFGRVVKNHNNIPNKIRQAIPMFPQIHERLRGVQIENLDWRQCFKDFDAPNALFYLDPPYYGSDVYGTGFTRKDHIEMCQRIFDQEGAVVLSGYENPVYDSFPWDSIHLNDAVDNRVTTMAYDDHNNMAGREGTTERGVRKEYLWIKEAYE